MSNAYERPMIKDLGSLQDLTLACDKETGGSDGFTFMGQPIQCKSS